VGGGEHHYHILSHLSESESVSRPIVLVSQKYKCLHSRFAPLHLKDKNLDQNLSLDLWSLCQKRGVEFIEDSCVDVSFDDQTLFLQNYGKLKFSRLCFDFHWEGGGENPLFMSSPSVISASTLPEFHKQLASFFMEVHRHCPRDVRVIISGLSRYSLDYAYQIQKELKKSVPDVQVVIVEDPNKVKNQGLNIESLNRRLGGHSIRIIEDRISHVFDHKLKLGSEQSLEFDIYLPLDQWRCVDLVGRRWQSGQNQMVVQTNLGLKPGNQVYAIGRHLHVGPDSQNTYLPLIPSAATIKVAINQLWGDQSQSIDLKSMVSLQQQLMQAPYMQQDWLGRPYSDQEIESRWHEQKKMASVASESQVFEQSRQSFAKALDYESKHMSHPWSGLNLSSHHTRSQPPSYSLFSMNGFNWWGSYSQSAQKITEMALLQAMCEGVQPTHLSFQLGVPAQSSAMRQHIFESSFCGLSNLCEQRGIQLDGGHTYDNEFWQLYVTVGGERAFAVGEKLQPHDYLLITRPLGYGPLWTSRLSVGFDSSWVTEERDQSPICPWDQLGAFVREFQPSRLIFVGEWGLLYHCMPYLPAKNQMIINFREVPRWSGLDQVIATAPSPPGADTNWQRVADHLPFRREEVSPHNLVLWDSLSLGAIVIGVRAENYTQALASLRKMGYSKANLIGCVRPKTQGSKFILSDWKPQ
jgi:hypothetical protein